MGLLMMHEAEFNSFFVGFLLAMVEVILKILIICRQEQS